MCKLKKKNHSADSKGGELWKKEKITREVKHTKNIPYPEAKKLIENSLATTTYANIAKPTNHSTQNQGIMTHFDVIKEVKTLLELQRENLTN